MSPILVRPVREQLEHDRLIRFLLNKYKRKSEALANVGDERSTGLKIGQTTFFPDLVLTDGKKLTGVAEIETGESVNNLEALAQWVHFSKARVPFHLYVPVQSYDSARRLCEINHVAVAEIWTYRGALDGFDLVRMFNNPSAANAGPRTPAATVVRMTKPAEPERPAVPEVIETPKPAALKSAPPKAAVPQKATAKMPLAPKAAAPPQASKPAKPVAKAKPARSAKPAKPAKPAPKAKPPKASKPSKPAKSTKKAGNKKKR